MLKDRGLGGEVREEILGSGGEGVGEGAGGGEEGGIEYGGGHCYGFLSRSQVFYMQSMWFQWIVFSLGIC